MKRHYLFAFAVFLPLFSCSPAEEPPPPPSPAQQVLADLERGDPYNLVSEELFEQLGWDLPDGGQQVKQLADAAEGGAFDPKDLESLLPEQLGYRARWNIVRFPYYGLEWEITGLSLVPNEAEEGLPTVAILHGGSANLYEFFLDPLNNPGLGQYLAQRIPVLLMTIPGNYRPGGWEENSYGERVPGYLLEEEMAPEEVAVRNAILTFTLIADGVARLIEQVTDGPVLIAGHSTGGELQFLLQQRLQRQLRGLSLGWGTGGPAVVRRQWDLARGAERQRFPPLVRVRARAPEGYINGYVGPLNPLTGTTDLEIAQQWFAAEQRRRPQFKQPIQDLEHQGQDDQREEMEKEIRAAVTASGLEIDLEQILADLFSTMRSPLDGYRRMIWTVAAKDDGHWDPDPEKARELYVADQFRQANPEAEIRVLVFDVPMTHFGHIEKPRQLAGGILAAVQWLVSTP